MKNYIRIAKFAAVLLTISFGSGNALAQEDDGGPLTQGEDAVYVSVTFVKYKPGTRSAAFELIAEHFMPAGKAAGSPAPWATHFQTGPWDATFSWKLEGGMKDLEWFRSPNNIKFMESLAKQEGSKEAAEALFAKYYGMVAKSQTEVGHFHDGEDDDE